MLVTYFKGQYLETYSKSVDQLMEDLATIPIPKIDQQQKDLLECPVTDYEIEKAIHQLSPHKAPGPDGIPTLFYREFWSIAKQDILNSTHAFFHSGSLLKSLNQTFLTLIPKVQFPDDVSQFRPISLCNVVYKIISKIMVERLKPLMDKLITPYQNAFIRGRNITDNILLAHEIFDTLRKKKGRKKGYCALKIDMSKAYDRVNWNFLKAVLLSMNFGTTWINWIMECVTTVQYTLLVNGSPIQPFHPSRGLRQGDPLSPYLFLFCANILSVALIDAENHKKIKGVKIGRNGVSFTHIFFADDSFFFFQNDNTSLPALKTILLWYCSLSGQTINHSKSELFCSPNIDTSIQESLASYLQVNLVKEPSMYLGINFNLRGKNIADFQDLIDRVQKKLQGWKAKLLSQAGRCTLISSVLQSMPLYSFSCFKIPEAVCNKLDAITRAFWWGHNPGERKLHLINWDTICQPKARGGHYRKMGFRPRLKNAAIDPKNAAISYSCVYKPQQ